MTRLQKQTDHDDHRMQHENKHGYGSGRGGHTSSGHETGVGGGAGRLHLNEPTVYGAGSTRGAGIGHGFGDGVGEDK